LGNLFTFSLKFQLYKTVSSGRNLRHLLTSKQAIDRSINLSISQSVNQSIRQASS